jgi:hypothetical protein
VKCWLIYSINALTNKHAESESKGFSKSEIFGLGLQRSPRTRSRTRTSEKLCEKANFLTKFCFQRPETVKTPPQRRTIGENDWVEWWNVSALKNPCFMLYCQEHVKSMSSALDFFVLNILIGPQSDNISRPLAMPCCTTQLCCVWLQSIKNSLPVLKHCLTVIHFKQLIQNSFSLWSMSVCIEWALVAPWIFAGFSL